MTTYAKLDFFILENIRMKTKPCSLTAVSSGRADQESRMLGYMQGRESYRVIDGRLQAMKKHGLIRHVRGKGVCGWEEVK